MIRSYSDHAANERTFLAWVRTAVAIMAFGFVVEKFNIFVETARAALGVRAPHLASQRFGEVVGLVLMVMGLAMVAVAAGRFLRTARAIDDDGEAPGPGARLDVSLAVLLLLLGCALVGYLFANVVGGS